MDDRLTILLIDDAAADRAMCRRFLEGNAHYTCNILEASSATEALQWCENSDLDLVLLDYRLPDRDGLEFLAALKLRMGERYLPIIMLTGQGNEAIAVQAMKLGVNDYLVKGGLTQDSLCRTVRSVMIQYRLQQQLEQQQQQQQALRQQLQQLNAELETKVQERTAALQESERQYRRIAAESQQAADDLRKSQSLYKSLTDALPLCLFRKDWNDRFTFVNQAFLDLVQLPLEECLGKTTRDLNPPDLAERYLADDLRVLQTGEILDLIEMIEDPETGIRRYVQTVKAPVRNDAGDIVEMQGIFWDVTDRKQAAQRLELQSIIIRNVAEGVCLVRASDGVIVYTNPRFGHLFGYAPEELNGQHISVVNYGDALTARSVHATIVDHLDREGNYNYEVHNRKKDGTPFWSRVNASRFEHPDYGTVYVSVQDDITDRKAAEQALKQTHQELTYLIEHTPLGTIKWDREFRVDMWSPRAEAIFGWKAEDVMGKTLDEWPFIFEADREHVDRVVSQMMSGISSICHNRNYRQDGSVIHCTWYNSALLDETGHLVSMLSFVQDVTEATRIEAERNQAIVALQESVAKQQALITALPDLVMRISGDGIYSEFVSTDVFNVVGETGAFIGTHVLDSLPPAVGQMRLEAIQAALQTGTLQTYQQVLWINHQAQTEEVRVVPCGSDEVLVVVRDISERVQLEADRKQAEDALQESERRLSTLISNLPGYVYQVANDPHYTPEFISEGVFKVTGYRQEEYLVDRTISCGQEIHPDDAVAIWDLVQAAIADRQPYECEYRIITKAGEQKWVWERGQGVYAANGELTHLEGFVTDISDRHAAAEENRQLRERLQFLLSATPAIVYTSKAEGDYNATFISDNLRLQMGYEPSDFVDESGFWANHLHPDDAPNLFAGLAALFEHGYHTAEYRFLHKDGTYRWMQDGMRLVRNANGEPTEIVGYWVDITDRKQAEDALRSSEARFRSIFDHAAIGIAQVTLAGRYFNANQAMCTLLGYTKAELQTLTFQALTHPDDLAAELEQNQQLLAGDIPAFSMEKRLLHKQGQVVWAMLTVSRVCDQHGNPQYCIGIVEDITDRKLTEMALQESEERFREIANTIPQMFFVRSVNPDRYAYISPAYETIWGRSRDELIQNPSVWMESLHPDDRAHVEASVASQMQGNSVRREYRILRPDGAVRWIAAEIVTLRDAAGAPLRFIGLADDITARKGAEEALQKSETQYRRIVETATEGIWIIDADSKTHFVNPALTAMLGYSDDEMMGESMFAFMDEGGKAIAANNVKRRRDGIQERHDFKFRRKDGSDLWVIISTTPILDDNGQYAGALGMLTDISDRKQTEQELQRAKEAAVREAMRSTEANRAKSIFLSSMSHELRTPLNAILGFSQLMAFDSNLNSDQQENIAIINRSGEHLLTIINDILEMSKIEAGRITFNVVEFDLFGLLDRLEEMFRLQTRNKGILLYCDRALDLPQYIQTDENKLRQILINLLGNALKFTRQGRVSLRVTRALEPNSKGPGALEGQESQPESVTFDPPHLAQRQRSQSPEVTAVPTALASSLHLCFEVEDTGAGIDPEELESLFEPFVQSRSGKIHPEGTGLGLPISQQFVRLMGGELTVTSVPDHGSTFAFTIPVMLAAPLPALLPLPRSQGPLVLAPDQPTYRILLVEDTWSNRQLLLSLIQPLGFEVQEAINGQEAVSLWQTWQPHLIWMDIRMPVMDGYEATRRIRAIEQSQVMPQPFTTKIIALTAHAFEEERLNALASGCDDFVHKPLQAASILTKMSEHLGVRYSHGTSESSTQRPSPCAPAWTPQQSAPALLNATALQKMPVEWLLQLHRAATQQNATRLQELIAQMPADAAAIAQALQAMVNNMDFGPMTQLAQDATNHTIKHF